MQPNQQTPSPTVDFETSAMFDAHGFRRGELLKPQFPHLNGTDLRELLAKVVERHVLPQLDQAVQVMVIPSARNPVRATRVNGQEVVWHNAEAGTGPQVTPAVVQVSEAAIRDCLDKAKQKPLPADNIDDLELEAAAG
jgi:hypothetical protein